MLNAKLCYGHFLKFHWFNFLLRKIEHRIKLVIYARTLSHAVVSCFCLVSLYLVL